MKSFKAHKVVPIREHNGILLFGVQPDKSGLYQIPIIKFPNFFPGLQKIVFPLKGRRAISIEYYFCNEEFFLRNRDLCWITLQEVPIMICKEEIAFFPKIVKSLLESKTKIGNTESPLHA